ncbi:MAG: TIGR01458 family HAD-type hydrolase [Gammaproteobacteria bacterium]|nr:TIGR01458 family HAD-type hydrolase [Gammaproteobacteria bacterium]
MKAILFDLDGVLYVGDRPVEGAAQTVDWCRQAAISHLFVTNTTSKPRAAIAAKLTDMGIPVSEQEILTPPVAAVQWLQENQLQRLSLFVSDITKQEFSAFTLIENEQQETDAVIVGDMGEAWDFMTLNRAFRFLMQPQSPQLLALGLTRYWRAEDGLRLDAGAYVSALQYASGRAPVVLGKPASAFYNAALHRLGIEPEQAVMVGDDIKGDIEGAQCAGMQGILVRTGKFQESDLKQGIQPSALIDSVADLPAWWESSAS